MFINRKAKIFLHIVERVQQILNGKVYIRRYEADEAGREMILQLETLFNKEVENVLYINRKTRKWI